MEKKFTRVFEKNKAKTSKNVKIYINEALKNNIKVILLIYVIL